MTRRREEYRPPFAPHVRGTYDADRVDEHGDPVDQLVEITCEHPRCARVPPPHWRVRCTSGNVRAHVARFAVSHVHDEKRGK